MKKQILEKETKFMARLKKTHPNGKMRLGPNLLEESAVLSEVTLPKGFDMGAWEVTEWFEVKPMNKAKAE